MISVAAVGRQAVQHHRVVGREPDETAVDPVPGERLPPHGLLGLGPHRDPRVREDHVGPRDRLLGCGRADDPAAFVPSPRHDCRVRGVRRRRGHADLHARQARREDQGVADVVAVPDPCRDQAVGPAEALTDGEDVGQELARVLAVREPVDHGHGRVGRELLDRLVAVGPDHHGRDVAREDTGRVRDRLAAPQAAYPPGSGGARGRRARTCRPRTRRASGWTASRRSSRGSCRRGAGGSTPRPARP